MNEAHVAPRSSAAMVLALAGQLVSFVLCYLLPAYSSYKALRTGSRKAVIKLLMYWTVLSVFKGAEAFADVFLGWYGTATPSGRRARER